MKVITEQVEDDVTIGIILSSEELVSLVASLGRVSSTDRYKSALLNWYPDIKTALDKVSSAEIYRLLKTELLRVIKIKKWE